MMWPSIFLLTLISYYSLPLCSLMFLEHARHKRVHVLVFFVQIPSWLTSSPPTGLDSNVIFPVRLSMSTLIKIAPCSLWALLMLLCCSNLSFLHNTHGFLTYSAICLYISYIVYYLLSFPTQNVSSMKAGILVCFAH